MKTEFDFSFDRPVHGEELLGGSNQLARASWLARHVRNDDVYFMQDGTLSQLLFREVLSTFIAGQHIATIVLAFSLVERTVAGRLAFVGDKSGALAKSEALLKNALERGWLRKEEHEFLDELRKLRNPIVHFRDHLSDTRPEVRAALTARTTEQVLESDAKRILEATIHVLQKTAL
jgi:hypothetical protein